MNCLLRSLYVEYCLGLWENKDDKACYVFRGNANGRIITDPKKVILKIKENLENNAHSSININWHDLRRTYGSLAESVNVSSYTLKRLLNHKNKRTDDVTAGYIVLDHEELIGPTRRIEQAILEHAGLKQSEERINATLTALLGGLSQSEKRKMIFQLSESSPSRTKNN
ncbi:hypothetical protein L3081_05925 [Colwellia sp. MSW7]|uniref:Tyr recombinase domain-containing protein n=1 Tax=Colwellia maritima TaxID=2912588 RepID=A0ABS9WYD8_9GAMM|nr:hypothetical protein [Colwellia maritima]MCI2283018.1 hypothetical protein [Colwellia maritima]